MRSAASAFALVMCVVMPSGGFAESPTDKVPVFVRSAQAAGGFSDPSKARQDSVKDLIKKVADSKVVRLASTEAEAVLVLEVLSRETKRSTNLMGRQNKSYLTVRLTVGEFSTEFEGESGSKGVLTGYGAAAGKVVKQLDAWVLENRENLVGGNEEPAPGGVNRVPTPAPSPE